MSSIGTLEIDLLLESSSFLSGLKKAQEATAESAASIKESLDFAKEAVIGLAEAFAVDFIIEKVNSALEYSEAIKKVAEQTGLTTTQIQAFNYAASQAGVSTEDSNAALEKFNVSLGKAQTNNKLATMFKDLGVTSTNASVALGQFADGLEKVPTKSQRAADVVAAFGKGAGGLTEILAEGQKGLDEYTKSAEELGIVLSGDVINGAVEAEHKISALKMVITAEWANLIDQNANAIASLATSMIQLTAAVAGFIGSHPEIALGIMGALAGGALGGLPGAAIGGLAGAAAGGSVASAMADGNNDLQYRKTQLRSAQSAYDSAKAGTNGGGVMDTPYGGAPAQGESLAAATADFQKQIGYMNRALAAHNALTAKAPKSPVLPGPKGPKAPKDHSADIAAAFEKALGSVTLETYSLKGQLATDPAVKANYERQSIQYDYGYVDPDSGQHIDGQKDKEIDDQQSAGKFGPKNSALAIARATELKNQNDLNGQLKLEVVNRTLDAQLAAQDLALKTSSLTNQEDLLKGQQSLARTADERAKIGEQLIDLDTQMQAAQLDAVLASKDSTIVEKQIAAARKALLPQLADQAKAKNAQDNSGPIASYLNAMPKTVGEIGESLQTAAVSGLGSLTDGITAAINGTGSLKSAFKSLASSIITDLEKIVIEEEIVKPLANLLTGGSGGGGGLLGSLAKGLGSALGLATGSSEFSAVDGLADGSISSIIAANPIPLDGARANGGLTEPGSYLMGERGPEIVSIGAAANVTPNHALDSLGGASGGININSTVSGVNDPAQTRRLAAQTLAQAAPALMRMSSDQTMARSRQRKMR